MTASPRYLMLISGAETTCGVETFARLAAARLGARCATHILGRDVGAVRRALREADAVILNFPIVAWKARLIEPLAVAILARMMGKAVLVILHEWGDLDWRRRAVLAPVCAAATAILFSAPEVAEPFEAGPVSTLATGRRDVIPIPPNVLPAGDERQTALSETLRGWREKGRLILGQFGSIYPKKQTGRVLDVAAALIGRGHDVGVVFAGSFIKGRDDVEGDFYRHAAQLGLDDRLLVTGHVAEADELSAILAGIDVFCYAFPEGLTSRRGSVLAAALSGKPVVVNAPRNPRALDHHPLLVSLVANRSIRLASHEADADELAGAVLENRADGRRPNVNVHAEVGRLWAGITDKIDRAARRRQSSSERPNRPLASRPVRLSRAPRQRHAAETVAELSSRDTSASIEAIERKF